MLLRIIAPISRFLHSNSRLCLNSSQDSKFSMGSESRSLVQKKKNADFRLLNVSGFKTDLLEINSHEPTFHVLFIPGNPGVISFYTEFLESLYELLGGTASITGIGHISHSQKNWESQRLFSLEEQINHKISFIEQELQDVEVPLILVGHSIGSYISLEILKRSHKKVVYCIGLSPALCAAVSSLGALLGVLPLEITRFLVKISMGKSWSSSAVEVLCTHVLKYHTLRNMLFMAMTEFQTMPEKPDWDFMRSKRRQISFLFGLDDHWGPMHLYEEICKQVPDARVEVEREGHTHAFSCSGAGSIWVAKHVSSLIMNNILLPKSS